MTVTLNPTVAFVNDAWKNQKAYILHNARYAKRCIGQGWGAAKTVLICGAGPSLRETFAGTVLRERPDQIWACNSALPWLLAEKLPVTHGVGIAGEDGILQDFKPYPNVHYILSSGVCPTLVRILDRKHRRMWFFHNLINVFPTAEEEVAWYGKLYPQSLVVQGGGYNVTNRAAGLALGAGFSRVVVAGADCCVGMSTDPMPDTATHGTPILDWAKQQTMYVDGRDPVTAYGPKVQLLEGIINGRRFVSRGDMLLSAEQFWRMKQHHPARLELVGDTLPNWLLRFPEATWREFIPRVENGVMTNLKPIALIEDGPAPPAPNLALSPGVV